MNKYTQLYEALKSLTQSADVLLTTAEVVSIEGDTCTVKVGELKVPDVRLRATKVELEKKLLITPAVGSLVLIGSLSGDLRELAVLACDSVESVQVSVGDTSATIDENGIVFNDGTLGGMVAIEKLTTKLNALKDTLNNLVTAFNSHIHTTTATIGTGPALGVIAPTTTQAQSAAEFSKIDYENEKVKQ